MSVGNMMLALIFALSDKHYLFLKNGIVWDTETAIQDTKHKKASTKES